MVLKKSLVAITSAVLLSNFAIAAPAKHMVIAPQCLLKFVPVKFKTLSNKKELSLIEVDQDGIEQLSLAKHQAKQPCGGFTDVTRAWNKQQSAHQLAPANFLTTYTAAPALTKKHGDYQIQFEKETQAVLNTIDTENMWAYLTKITSAKEYKDRYANSKDGVKAANWIKSEVEAMAKKSGHTDVSVYLVDTNGYDQPSVVAKLGNSDAPGIVIGGHMDTLSSAFSGHKPGADDDGSGTVTVLETARTILDSGMQFQKPIYFIWYSAEEEGLVGSDSVVAKFQENNIPVEAAVQFDMTGYAGSAKNDSTMWLMTDFVDADLTAYLEKLIKTYVKKPYKFSKCGYGCSDHASWHQAGIASAFPFEAAMNQDNPDIHSNNDTMKNLSKEHMQDFLKLAVAYIVEMGNPVSK